MTKTRTDDCKAGDHADCDGMVANQHDADHPLRPCSCSCHAGGSVRRLHLTNPELRSSGWSGAEEQAAA